MLLALPLLVPRRQRQIVAADNHAANKVKWEREGGWEGEGEVDIISFVTIRACPSEALSTSHT